MGDEARVGSTNVAVESLGENDINQLESILAEYVRDRNTGEILLGEINDIKEYMKGGKDEYGRTRTYFVAKDVTGRVLGCVAYSEPDPDMLSHFDTTLHESAELSNAFVSDEVRGLGIGRMLFNAVCDAVKQQGKKQILVNSGPRYKASWGFYDKVCDESCGFIAEKYGKGGDAKTWRKVLMHPAIFSNAWFAAFTERYNPPSYQPN